MNVEARCTRVPEGYYPTDQRKVIDFLPARQGAGEIVTGLLYVVESDVNLHEMNLTRQRR